MDKRADLSEFLRSRRARLRPEDVGLPTYGRRRVPGLRREELAQLAGVSVDYYVRLEQGRTQNVSEEVLDAVADALRLDEDERAHLRDLAKPSRTARRRPADRPERVRPGLHRLLESMADRVPAYITGRRGDVLAWNRLAAALFTDFGALPAAERNWTRLIFLNEDVQGIFADWTTKGRETVAHLRLQAGRYPEDRRLAALVGELSVKNEDFRRWWADHNVRDKTYARKVVHHPLVGELVLDCETFRLSDDPDQVLVTYTVEAGTPSEAALALLAGWGTSVPTS